jgi:hypothetical protein
VTTAKAREFFAETVRKLDDALVKSASTTHEALQQLASRGQDFTDNDLKEALVSLRKLEEDYVAVSNSVGLRRASAMPAITPLASPYGRLRRAPSPAPNPRPCCGQTPPSCLPHGRSPPR